MCRGTDLSFFLLLGYFVNPLLNSVQRDHVRIKELSERLIKSINTQVEHVIRNGDVEGYPGCVNLSFSYVEGESLLMALKVKEHHLTCIFRRLTW